MICRGAALPTAYISQCGRNFGAESLSMNTSISEPAGQCRHTVLVKLLLTLNCLATFNYQNDVTYHSALP